MWFLELPKAPASENPFEVKELRGPEDCWNVSRGSSYVNFPLMSEKLRTERSLLARSQILRLCFNKSTGDYIYFRLNRKIYLQLVRTKFSQKPKTFPAIVIVFFEST